MDDKITTEILGDAERVTLGALCLHHRLAAAGDTLSADEAWVLHLGASAIVDRIGDVLGVEEN
jgi:hypothetical protein